MRTRLLVVVLVSVGVALALMTLAFNVLLAQSLDRDARSVLRTRAGAEAAAVEVSVRGVVAPELPDSGGLESQAWIFAGSRTVERPNVGGALDRAARRVAAAPGVTLDVSQPPTRLLAVRAPDNPGVVVVAGVSLAPYQTTQRIALLGSLAFAAVLFVVVAFIARWMLRAALRPVVTMSEDVEQWSAHDPSRRFAAGEPFDELSRLAATLDSLLDRISASLRREQRFSAEVSHELRTPLAKVQTEAELALRRRRSPDQYREALEMVAANARQMASTVETLVAASQQESGLSRGCCDARSVADAVAAASAGLAAEHGVSMEVSGAGAAVGVDADVATRVLTPVVENACRMAATKVALSVVRAGSGVVIGVDDDGPGVLPDEREHIFEPGVRGSAGVAGGHAGAGLGLALSRRLARAAGGDVTIAEGGAGGHFSVLLPAG